MVILNGSTFIKFNLIINTIKLYKIVNYKAPDTGKHH